MNKTKVYVVTLTPKQMEITVAALKRLPVPFELYPTLHSTLAAFQKAEVKEIEVKEPLQPATNHVKKRG